MSCTEITFSYGKLLPEGGLKVRGTSFGPNFYSTLTGGKSNNFGKVALSSFFPGSLP